MEWTDRLKWVGRERSKDVSLHKKETPTIIKHWSRRARESSWLCLVLVMNCLCVGPSLFLAERDERREKRMMHRYSHSLCLVHRFANLKKHFSRSRFLVRPSGTKTTTKMPFQTKRRMGDRRMFCVLVRRRGEMRVEWQSRWTLIRTKEKNFRRLFVMYTMTIITSWEREKDIENESERPITC